MQKIFSNKVSCFIECEFCGVRMTERPFEVWANVPDDMVDFAVEDNQRMEDEARKEWEVTIDKFIEQHKKCCQ